MTTYNEQQVGILQIYKSPSVCQTVVMLYQIYEYELSIRTLLKAIILATSNYQSH